MSINAILLGLCLALLSVPSLAASKSRRLAPANQFLRTGQELPDGRRGAGMVLLRGYVVVFGGITDGGKGDPAHHLSDRCTEVRPCHLLTLCLTMLQCTGKTCTFTTSKMIFGTEMLSRCPASRLLDRIWDLQQWATRPFCLAALAVSCGYSYETISGLH